MTHPIWKTLGATLAALTLLGGLTACGGGGGGGSSDTTTSTTSTTADVPYTPPAALAQPRFAYAANATSDTISVYQVNATTGQWRPKGYALTGRRPSSITVDPSGQFAYTTNFYGNSISAYTIDAGTGALSKVGDDVPTGRTPSKITIDAQHRYAYVTCNCDGGAISIFAIDPTTGTLSKSGKDVPTGAGPLGLVFSPSGQFAYVATREAETLQAFAIDAQTGALTPIGDPLPMEVPDAILMAPNGRHVHVLTDSGYITTFAVDAQTGALSRKGLGDVIPGAEAVALAITPSGKFGYQTDKSRNTVTAFAVDTASGTLTSLGEVEAGKQPVAVTVDASGQFAYVANGGDHTVSAYRIDPFTGQLSPVGLVRAQLEPSAIALVNGPKALSVTALALYAGSMDPNTVSAYAIDAQTGALTQGTQVAQLSSDTMPTIVATDPLGRHVYVAQDTSNDITVYGPDASGTLHALSTVSQAFDDDSRAGIGSLVADPSGRFVYASFTQAGKIVVYAVDASTGTLTEAGQIATLFMPGQLLMDPLGLYLYGNSPLASAIMIWRIDPVKGGLSPLDSIIHVANVDTRLAIDPAGRRVYWGDDGEEVTLHAYAIDGLTGNLVDAQPVVATPDTAPLRTATALTTAATKLMARGLTIDPSGRFAYASIYNGDASYSVMRTYAISATGALSKVDELPFGDPDNYQGPVAVDPTGRFVYAFDSRMATTYSINANTGVLSKVGDVATVGGAPFAVVVWGIVK